MKSEKRDLLMRQVPLLLKSRSDSRIDFFGGE